MATRKKGTAHSTTLRQTRIGHRAKVGRAIPAGWLVALLVWLLPFAETARVLVIIIITYIIGIGEFYHIIAGTVEASYGVLTGSIKTGEALPFIILHSNAHWERLKWRFARCSD